MQDTCFSFVGVASSVLKCKTTVLVSLMVKQLYSLPTGTPSVTLCNLNSDIDIRKGGVTNEDWDSVLSNGPGHHLIFTERVMLLDDY